MIKKISIKTEVGWVSAFENNGKIFKIKFGKVKKQVKSRILKNFKKNLIKFFEKKTLNIKAPYNMEGNQIQKKVTPRKTINIEEMNRLTKEIFKK